MRGDLEAALENYETAVRVGVAHQEVEPGRQALHAMDVQHEVHARPTAERPRRQHIGQAATEDLPEGRALRALPGSC